MKAGKYTVDAQGHNGKFMLTVTVDGDRIEDVKVAEGETAGISDAALKRIPEAIVKGQTLNVDVVSGASLTSRGILDGVGQAIEMAGGDAEEFKQRPKYQETESESGEVTVDVAGVG
ncbi:FMN-binding protein, partial [Lactobacillus delbrueckii]|uniref:FMN-binding protein n=1 Tax=Lactobacillus delbrueckii TaxID=1584 RepID=UPI001F1685D5